MGAMTRYKHYKPSGIEWIGEIPAHWEERRFGTLFYELSTIGTPPILINPTSYHTEIADLMLNRFSKNLAINLGDFNKINADNLKKRIERLSPYKNREKMSNVGKKYFDGRGIERIVDSIGLMIK